MEEEEEEMVVVLNRARRVGICHALAGFPGTPNTLRTCFFTFILLSCSSLCWAFTCSRSRTPIMESQMINDSRCTDVWSRTIRRHPHPNPQYTSEYTLLLSTPKGIPRRTLDLSGLGDWGLGLAGCEWVSWEWMWIWCEWRNLSTRNHCFFQMKG